MQPDLIMALLPMDDNDPLCWLVRGDSIVQTGALSDLATDAAGVGRPPVPIILLVPASYATYRRLAAQGLEPRQELAVAKIKAQERVLGNAQTAVAFDPDGNIQIATMESALLQNALDRLAARELTVTAVVPMGAAFKPSLGELWQVKIGEHTMLCGADLCCADEPALASTLFGEAVPRICSEAECAQALVVLAHNPAPNFLDGLPARRNAKPIFSDVNRTWIKRLSVLAACLFIGAAIATWAKLEWAIARENRVALAAAQSIDPAISDINQAEAAIDATLARKGIHQAKPAMLVAIIWQSVKAQENVALTDVNLQRNGLLSATIAAPDAESINAVLLSIQRASYRITATPRRDASGTTLVDVTVKAP